MFNTRFHKQIFYLFILGIFIYTLFNIQISYWYDIIIIDLI